jgi:hypothetical protein
MAKRGRLKVIKTNTEYLFTKKGFNFSFDFNVSVKAKRD